MDRTLSKQQLLKLCLGWKPKAEDYRWTAEQLRRWKEKVKNGEIAEVFKWRMTGGEIEINFTARTAKVTVIDINDCFTVNQCLLIMDTLGWTIQMSDSLIMNGVYGKPLFNAPDNFGGYDKFHG